MFGFRSPLQERTTGGLYGMYICTLRQMGVLLFKGLSGLSLAVVFSADAALIQGAAIECMNSNYRNCGY